MTLVYSVYDSKLYFYHIQTIVQLIGSTACIIRSRKGLARAAIADSGAASCTFAVILHLTILHIIDDGLIPDSKSWSISSVGLNGILNAINKITGFCFHLTTLCNQ